MRSPITKHSVLRSPVVTRVEESPHNNSSPVVEMSNALRTPDSVPCPTSSRSFFGLDDSTTSLSELSPCVLSQQDYPTQITTLTKRPRKTLGIQKSTRRRDSSLRETPKSPGLFSNKNQKDESASTSVGSSHFPSYMNIRPVKIKMDRLGEASITTKPRSETSQNTSNLRQSRGKAISKRFRFVRRSPLADISAH